MLDLDRRWDRPAPTPEQVRIDVELGVAIAVLAAASAEVWHSAYGSSLGWRGVESHVLFAGAGLVLAGRRRFPLTTLVLESAVFIVIGERLAEVSSIFTLQIILFTAIYTAWAWSDRPRRLERPIVRHRRVGTPFDVPGTVQLSLFRIAQEAVANVRRHAHAASAEVVLRFVAGTSETERAVEVEVIDDATSLVAGPVGSACAASVSAPTCTAASARPATVPRPCR